MSLFQNSVLNKYLKGLDSQKVNDAYAIFTSHFHNPTIQENIRNSKEEQYQGEFLIDLFVNVFGYIKNPTPHFNLTTELKNTRGSQKTDGAILKGEKALAVIELKGTNTTDLSKVETQAFGYKNNQAGCNYVITSNFEKLRFYITDAVDFEEFNLFQLSKERFEILWLCLSSEYLLKDIPKKIKDESLTQEENITKQLYKDYASFRNEIFDSIHTENPQYDKLTLFKKTQKLLDRFLFIFFAEDRLLLPPNSIRAILNQWTDLRDKYDEYFPLYDRFKKYFGYMNTGHKGQHHDVFAYNGGLFAPDDILDSININDELLYKHTVNLSNYNFESEVSVNILGHIFEHSLNDIEAIQSEIEGIPTNQSQTKRKKDGVFYTPKYITKYIVDNTVGKLCEEKKTELDIQEAEYEKERKGRQKATLKTLAQKLEAYRQWLLQITICDPACGSGAFLNQALEFLIAEHRYVDELQAKLFGDAMILSEVENTILENNLFGVDINEESVDIAKLSLWLRTAQKGRKLTSLNNNIKCGNSLIDDPTVAGEKAFNWKNEFPEVFAKGGFDVVIGNPPYVFARDNISQELKNYYIKNYVSAEYQVNTYLLFIEQTINIIRNTANFGLIIPNAWLMVGSATGLRNFILQNCSISEIINLSGYSFEGVNVETIIILANKTKQKEEDHSIKVLLSNDKEFKYSHDRKQIDFEKNEGFEFKVFSDETSVELTNKLKSNSINLNNLVLIKSGLKAYQKGKGKPKQTAEDVKNRPFDYSYKFDDTTFPYLEGKDIGRYFTNWSGTFLRFGPFLAEPRSFPGEKIIVREITGNFPKSVIATYSVTDYLFNMSNIAIVTREEIPISLKYILAILNSQLMAYYFLKNTAKSVRKMFPKIILNDLRKFPFKEISKIEQQPFIERVDQMLTLNKDLQDTSTSFLGLLQSKFAFDKLTKKLENWHELSFGDILKELTKQKVQLSLTEEAQWMHYFKDQKEKAQTLKAQIDTTDLEIDQMVYKLYGLTEDEIEIVEAATT